MSYENLYETLGKNIRKVRKAKKMTQGELAEVLGVSKTSVTNYELGQRKISLESIVKLCSFYELTCDELIPLEHNQELAIISLHPEDVAFWEKWREEFEGQSFNENEVELLVNFAKLILQARSVDNGESVNEGQE